MTTNLEDLPAPNANVTFETREKPGESAPDINQFVTGIQEAASNGALQLPSRDIPQDQNHITQDTQIKPNYIPPQNNQNYIQESSQPMPSTSRPSISIDAEQLQGPVLIGILYFIFQLPATRKLFTSWFPFMFMKDGNSNLVGYVVMSFMFASVYYSTTLGINYLSI